MTFLGSHLLTSFEELAPMDFYRELFPLGALDEYQEHRECMTPGKYTAIALEITSKKTNKGKYHVERHTITDSLDELDELISLSKNFTILAPVSYAGKSRKSENARFMYALVIEVDGIRTQKDGYPIGLYDLIQQWSDEAHHVPHPTYVVSSGTGLHLYYKFEKPVPMFKNVAKEMSNCKRELTKKIWNKYVSVLTGEKIQYESIFQGFRIPGTVTKSGERVEVFRTGEPVTLEYLNGFVSVKNRVSVVYRSELPLKKAKELYPEWYQRRIIEKQPRGRWVNNRALYDWWLRRIKDEAVVGHRYYCLMMLSIYAIKCEIDQEELEKDAFELMDRFDRLSIDPKNHFTEHDVLTALQAFEDKEFVTYPINSISNRSGLDIQKNKRNGRKQEDHLKVMRTMKKLKRDLGELKNDGRPSAEQTVASWRRKNPNGKKSDCVRSTGLTKPTVYKWWDSVDLEAEFDEEVWEYIK